MGTSSSTSNSSKSEDKPIWLSATEAADLCRVAHNTIRNWVKAGHLHPVQQMRVLPSGQRRAVQVFRKSELLKMIERRDTNEHGEAAARAFELFEQGQSLRQVVIALRQTPERIEELHDQWERCGGSELVLTAVAQRELVRLLGPFDGVADVVQLVAELVAELGQFKAANQNEQP